MNKSKTAMIYTGVTDRGNMYISSYKSENLRAVCQQNNIEDIGIVEVCMCTASKRSANELKSPKLARRFLFRTIEALSELARIRHRALKHAQPRSWNMS